MKSEETSNQEVTEIIDYDKKIHVDLLKTAIERMANNHFKFMIMFYSIIAFSIGLDKFIWELDTKFFLTFHIANFILSLIALIACFKMSEDFLKMERGFRTIQKRVLEGVITHYEMNPNKQEVKNLKGKKYGMTFAFQLIMLILFVVASITFMAMKEIYQ